MVVRALTRKDLQELARTRIKEAHALLRAGQYSGVYYLSGLAVECALKACIAKKTKRHDFPDKSVVNESWSHDLSKLLRTAGLQPALDRDSRNNAQLAQNWTLVKDWKVESRYESSDRSKASDLYGAVTARSHGVLAWIRRHW